MAFGQQQIFPIDLNNSAAVGISLPFNGPAVVKSNYQTKDSIKYNLINFFLTNPGERLLNPTFGGGIRNFIFEQIYTIQQITTSKKTLENELFFLRIFQRHQ